MAHDPLYLAFSPSEYERRYREVRERMDRADLSLCCCTVEVQSGDPLPEQLADDDRGAPAVSARGRSGALRAALEPPAQCAAIGRRGRRTLRRVQSRGRGRLAAARRRKSARARVDTRTSGSRRRAAVPAVPSPGRGVPRGGVDRLLGRAARPAPGQERGGDRAHSPGGRAQRPLGRGAGRAGAAGAARARAGPYRRGRLPGRRRRERHPLHDHDRHARAAWRRAAAVHVGAYRPARRRAGHRDQHELLGLLGQMRTFTIGEGPTPGYERMHAVAEKPSSAWRR